MIRALTVSLVSHVRLVRLETKGDQRSHGGSPFQGETHLVRPTAGAPLPLSLRPDAQAIKRPEFQAASSDNNREGRYVAVEQSKPAPPATTSRSTSRNKTTMKT